MKRVAELEELKAVRSKAGGFLHEFWAFAAKGNVFDLAVAVILGNAFGAVVNSFVADVAMPVLSLATGGLQDLSGLKYQLSENVVISYGHLMQVFLNFIIIALAIFFMFKVISGLRKRLAKKEEAHPEVKPDPTPDQKLLTEIRDALKQHLDSHQHN
ncbi:MAG: large conductance mechanosensitive channel protein MscL [Candidatus Pacebacteria bacterium]|nr:large conductance mechanosensitive channel protein MscL [Candidatus Paceibacterota bacterium]